MIPVIQIKGGKMHAILGTISGDTIEVTTMCGREMTVKATDGSIRDTDTVTDVTCKTCARRMDEEAHTTEAFAEFNREMGIGVPAPAVLNSPETVAEPRRAMMTLGRYRHGQVRHQRAMRRHVMKESIKG